MATFSSIEIRNQASRVNTETLNIQNQTNSAAEMCVSVGTLIRSAGDASAESLASSWDALADAFKACGNSCKESGQLMYEALIKYANETAENEETAASDTSAASEEILSLQDYFK